MDVKPVTGVLTSVLAPASATLVDTPWWMFVGVVVLALSHRVLPRDSKDLLNLWLRIIPRRDDANKKPKDGHGA
jgi:hypothetical protein